MRKAVRPPPKSYAEAKTPTATEVSFQHASPHKFTNVDEANPFGQFSEAHLLKGEGQTFYGPGAAYVSTAEPTHRSYMKKFKNHAGNLESVATKQIGPIPDKIHTYVDFTSVDSVLGSLPAAEYKLRFAKQSLEQNIQAAQFRLQSYGADPGRAAQEKRIIAGYEEQLNQVNTAIPYLQKLETVDLIPYKVEGPYSYRGSLAEDPARTVLFDKPLSEQLPEVEAALARASSRARKDIVPTAVESWGQQETGELLRKHFYNKIVETERAKFGETFDREYAPALGKKWADFNTAQQGSWLQQLKPDWDAQQSALLQRVENEVSRWNKNPKIAAKLPGLDPYTSYILQYSRDLPIKQTVQTTDTDKAGEYIKDYRASPKTVQRLRDAGIDLVKYSGSSASPNYVVVNPAAAKIQSRTPSIAATFGTGELARQLYESIYGKEAP